MLELTILGPPSLEEALGGLAKQFSEIVTQRFTQMSVYLGGLQARMSEQDLDNPDIHATLKHVRGKAVAERVRPELVVEAALASRFCESSSCGGIGQVRGATTTGKYPSLTAVDLPDLTKHCQDRFGQRKHSLLVSLADHVQDHLLRVDRGHGQSDRL
jgi:hypothetical protein